MKTQLKVKSIILLAIVVVIALFGLIGFQLFKIYQHTLTIQNQQKQITSLQEEIDYLKDKIPNENFDSITGENV